MTTMVDTICRIKQCQHYYY